jgi:superoxide dismutase, Fe-Mn family
MSPAGGKASPELAAAIDRDLGGLEKLQSDLNANGLRVFGLGWTLVTVTPDGRLALETKPNQDSVLMDDKRALFGSNVWGTCLLSSLPTPPRRLFEGLGTNATPRRNRAT